MVPSTVNKSCISVLSLPSSTVSFAKIGNLSRFWRHRENGNRIGRLESVVDLVSNGWPWHYGLPWTTLLTMTQVWSRWLAVASMTQQPAMEDLSPSLTRPSHWFLPLPSPNPSLEPDIIKE